MSMIDVVMLATPNIDYYAAETRENWQDYCDRQGYNFICWREVLLDDMHIMWSKLEMMRRQMMASQADWVLIVDADTLVNRPEIRLEELLAKHPGKECIVSEDASRRFGIPIPFSFTSLKLCKWWRAPNTGFMFIKNSEYGRNFLTRWIAFARTPEYEEAANTHPRTQRVLWSTLCQTDCDKIGVIGSEVRRVGLNKLLDAVTMNTKDAFVLHDKQLPLKAVS